MCFIPFDGISGTSSRKKFLAKHVDLSSADLVDAESGDTVGHTDSAELLSIGQRKGLGLGGHQKRRHVLDRTGPSGEVVVGDWADLLVETQPLDSLLWNGPPVESDLTIQSSAHGAR